MEAFPNGKKRGRSRRIGGRVVGPKYEIAGCYVVGSDRAGPGISGTHVITSSEHFRQ